MATIIVLGGTGYAGSNIVKVAAERGHAVTSYSRTLPTDRTTGVDYRSGDVQDLAFLSQAIADANVVISALSPRGELAATGILRQIEQSIAELADERSIRFGVIGGAGSLLVAEGGLTVAQTDDFPDEFKAEAAEMAGVLKDLLMTEPSLDWFFVSPAGGFGAWVPGEATGKFRIGGDVLLVDDQGQSTISGADLALAVVQEVEQPTHRRARFTVAY